MNHQPLGFVILFFLIVDKLIEEISYLYWWVTWLVGDVGEVVVKVWADNAPVMWQGLVFSLQILSSVWNKTHSLINVHTWRSTGVKTSWTNCHTFIHDMLKCCSAVSKMFIRNSLVLWSVVALWNTIYRWCRSDLSIHYTYATYICIYVFMVYPSYRKGIKCIFISLIHSYLI